MSKDHRKELPTPQAVYRVRQVSRNEARRLYEESLDWASLDEAVRVAVDGPEDDFITQEQVEKIMDLVRTFGEDADTIFTAFYVEQKTTFDIAGSLRIARDDVEKKLRMIDARLRGRINHDPYFD